MEELPGAEPPYERLLSDAMIGDGALFTPRGRGRGGLGGRRPRARSAIRGRFRTGAAHGDPGRRTRSIAAHGGWHNPTPDESGLRDWPGDVVFLLDCDNTLLDNDLVTDDLAII